MATNVFETIYGGPELSEAEKARLKAISDSVQRQRRLSAVATMSSDEGMRGVGRVLGVNAESDADRASQRFADEAASAAQLRKDLQSAADRKADREFREKQQADLQEYRRQSLVNAQLARDAAAARYGQLSAYQAAQLAKAEKAAETARAAKLDAGVQKYGADLTARAELDDAIRQANEAIAPYRKSGNIPGVGGVSNKEGWLGTVAAKLEGGSNVRNSVASVRNMILKARSGGAVTPQEGDRLLTEFGQAMGSNDADFIRAWDGFLRKNQETLDAIGRQYGAEVVGEYDRRRKQRDAAAQPGAPAQGRTKLGDY